MGHRMDNPIGSAPAIHGALAASARVDAGAPTASRDGTTLPTIAMLHGFVSGQAQGEVITLLTIKLALA